MNQTILITGGTGFLGQNLAKALLERNYNVTLVVRNIEKAKELHTNSPNLTLLKGDITQPSFGLSKETLAKLKGTIRTIYHCAALVKFNEELREEIFLTNKGGTKNALDLAKTLNVPQFHYVSTAYTVGKQGKGRESIYNGTQMFSNPYEESKCQAEQLVWDVKDQMNVTIFRPSVIIGNSITGIAESDFTVYGMIKVFEMFKALLAKKAPGTPLRYHFNHEGSVNVIPVDFVVTALIAALNHSTPSTIYNVTCTNNTKSTTIMESVKEVTDFPSVQYMNEEFEGNTFEKKLRKTVCLLEDYLNTNITFQNHNTVALINKELHLPEKMYGDIMKKGIAHKRQLTQELH